MSSRSDAAGARAAVKKVWRASPLISEEARAALRRWQDEPVIQQLFFNRGLTTESEAMAFVQRSLMVAADVTLLPDMPAAVERLVVAIERRDRIVISCMDHPLLD